MFVSSAGAAYLPRFAGGFSISSVVVSQVVLPGATFGRPEFSLLGHRHYVRALEQSRTPESTS
eukprot:1931475-Amphidinium_carterae.1